MLDYPTTAFLPASLRAFSLVVLLLIAGWLGYQLMLPAEEFNGRRLNDVLNQLVDAAPAVGEWTNSRVRAAQNWLTLDTYFALAYAALLSVGCGWLSQLAPRGLLARVGAMLSWGVLFGVVFDLAENGALVGLLAFSHHSLSRALAHAMRLLKWLPLVVTAGYGLWWLIALAIRKAQRR